VSGGTNTGIKGSVRNWTYTHTHRATHLDVANREWWRICAGAILDLFLPCFLNGRLGHGGGPEPRCLFVCFFVWLVGVSVTQLSMQIKQRYESKHARVYLCCCFNEGCNQHTATCERKSTGEQVGAWCVPHSHKVLLVFVLFA